MYKGQVIHNQRNRSLEEHTLQASANHCKPVVDAQPWRLGKTSQWRLPFSILAILVKGETSPTLSSYIKSRVIVAPKVVILIVGRIEKLCFCNHFH